MPPAISQDEINRILWKACDTFRGTVDPSEYKNYILVMLFVKYISDVWQDHYDQLKEQYGDDEERIQRRLRYERFALPAGCRFADLYAQRNVDNLGEVINMALEKIEEANKEKLNGVFRNIDFNSEANLGRTKQRNERLQHLLDDFADRRLDLRPSRVGNLDIISNAYEYLNGRYGIKLEEIIESKKVRDWVHNLDAQNQMKLELEDYLFSVKGRYDLPLTYGDIDLILDNVIEVARQRDQL